MFLHGSVDKKFTGFLYCSCPYVDKNVTCLANTWILHWLGLTVVREQKITHPPFGIILRYIICTCLVITV